MATNNTSPLSVDDLKKLKIPELKGKLQDLGLEVKGSKNELVARLACHTSNCSKSHSANKSVSSNSKANFYCPICEDAINDGTQESIFCSGPCDTWVKS